ncbi:MAG: winged helix-turn-helix domain-containing protein [Acidobacteriota bacterium]
MSARERYRVADLTLDVGAATVERAGESVALPKLSFDLLVALVRRAPDVVSVDELAELVWTDAEVSDETVVQRIALLRRALGDPARAPRIVRSVRGRGYQLVPPVEPMASADPAIEPAAATATDEGDPPHWRVAASIVVACIALGLAWLAIDRPESETAPRGPWTRPPVLVEWLERGNDYLTSQREADNELALELFEKALELAPDDPDALAGASLAHSFRTTRYNHPNEEADRAEALARQAITLAPDHARAHQALALALNARGRITPALDAYARAIELAPDDAASRASAAYLLMISGRLAEALEVHVAASTADARPTYLDVQIASNLALLGFDPAAAVWFERAVELRPDSVFAAIELARWHLGHGRTEDAERTVREALDRSVSRPELHAILGDIAWRRGDREAAREAYRRAQALDPAETRSQVRLLVLDGDEVAYADWVSASREARAGGDHWPPAAFDEAILHAGFGRDDEALAALDVAIDLGVRNVDAWPGDPILGSLLQRRVDDAARRLDRVRGSIAIERQRVLDAAWLPPSLLDAPAETPGKAGSR